MKYLATVLFAMTLLWVGGAIANENGGMGAIKNKPIVIEGGESARMTVVFTHKSHRNIGVSCIHCHHDSSSNTPYSSCRECHSTPGARERDPLSMFMAFHSRETNRSCYGCHVQLAEQDPQKYPRFKGCQPCHMSPQARAAAAAAKEAK